MPWTWYLRDEYSAEYIAMCKCHKGYTGTFCDVPVSTLSLPAFPSLYPGERIWYKDSYRDEHPLFNLSTIASVYVYMDEWDYEYLIAPVNAYNQSKVNSTVYFKNDVISVQLNNVAIGIKGQWSRKYMKKGWKLDFDKFQDDQKLIGQTEIGLKASPEDVTMLRNIITMESSRALGLPFQRVSFARLWINNLYHGFYVLYEEITPEWLDSRLPETTNPGLIKCHRAQLRYQGDHPSNYSDDDYEVDVGSKKVVKTAMIDLVKILMIPNNNTFQQQLIQTFDINRFVRYMVIEYLISNPDGYTWRGNNWWLYTDLTTVPPFHTYIPYDQEESYGNGNDHTALEWEQMSDIDFFVRCDRCSPHPLSDRLFGLDYLTFVEILNNFMQTVFGQPIIKERIEKYRDWVAPQLQKEIWYGLDATGINANTYVTQSIPALLEYIKNKSANQINERIIVN